MCSYLCLCHLHLLHLPCLLSAFVTSFSVDFDASASKYSVPYSRLETDGDGGILEFRFRMTRLGSLFVIRRAKVKTAVTKDRVSGFTEITHTIHSGYFFLYLVFVSMPGSWPTDTDSQGLLVSVSFGDTQPFQWGCTSLLHAEHAEAVVSWWCCLLWITSL